MLEEFDRGLDFFARLGLDPTWALSRDDLEDAYLSQSRIVHPDRHANADATTRRRAMEHSSALNEAYATLRDPIRRAEYMVKLGGIDLDSSDPECGAPAPSRALLIEMIERREHLADVAKAGSDALDELREDVEGEIEGVFDLAIQALLARGEGGPDIRAAAAALVHRRYLQRFLDEINALADDD